jgi:hypothetical protein
MNAHCSECKCCEAQPSMAADPKPLCIFCEDGVACPGRQKAARAVVTPAPSRLLTPPAATVRKPRNPNSPWRGNASLHLSDKAPEKPNTTAGVVPLQDEAAAPQQIDEVSTACDDRQEEEKERTTMATKQCQCGCGAEMPSDSKHAYLRGHKPGKAKRLCACGCGTPLVNRHPFIKGHNPDAKKAKNKGAAKTSKSHKAIWPPNGIATICVTEENLNSFWMRLSLEEKANLFQRQLEGGL